MARVSTNIVVLGGGYAGIMAALRIAGKTKRLDTTVTLINGLSFFVERPRLHEQATGAQLKGRPIIDMLRGSKAHFMQGWVTAIRPQEQLVMVETAAGQQHVPYDYLVNALGSRVGRHAVAGVDAHAYTLDPTGEMSTEGLRSRLNEFGAKPFHVVVVGGGATGIEMATQVKGNFPRSAVSLVTREQAGSFKGPRIRQHIQQALAEQGIQIYEQSCVLQVGPEGVLLESGWLTTDVVVWAAGFIASPLAREAGLRVNELNQVEVDPYLRSLSHPTIYAAGDMAFAVEEPGSPMRMSLFTALVSGAQAADNIVAEVKGESLRPFSFAWYGQGIALGPKDAVGFSTYPADAAIGPIFRRMTAVRIRNFFVWFIKAALEMERRLPGVLFWNGKKRYAKQREKQQNHAPIQA